MTEFDYQWKNIPSKLIEYNNDRIAEFLRFTDKLNVKDKYCLDAGCGNGRYTHAMIQLGGIVDSFDISKEAVKKCKEINAFTFTNDIMELKPNPIYNFVLCWGVLHHLENPHEGFKKVASQVRHGGILHIMVYHKDTQVKYTAARKAWKTMTEKERIDLCSKKKNPHGWYDAMNPKHNHGFTEQEIKKWFKGFTNIKLITKYNINMQGTLK